MEQVQKTVGWRRFWPFKKKNKKGPKKPVWREWVDALTFAIIAAFFIRTFLLEAFFIPSSSMERSLLVGDLLFVSKLNYGARLPMSPLALPFVHNRIPGTGIKSFVPGVQLPYVRLWGFQDVERNEPVVFNFPAHDIQPLSDGIGNVAIPTLKENYIKRCVGIAGDKVEIRNAQLYINGKKADNPPDAQYRYIIKTKKGENLMNCKDALMELGFREPVESASMEEVYAKSQNSNVYMINAFPMNGQSNMYAADTLGRVFWFATMPEHLVAQVAQLPCVDKVERARFDEKKDWGVRLASGPFYLPLEAGTVGASQLSFLSTFPKDYQASANPDMQLGSRALAKSWVQAPELERFKNWNLDNMGPFTIPKKGWTVKLTPETAVLYQRCIEVYEDNGKVEVRSGKVYIDGQPASSYTFEMDYYWMMGDNRYNSEDSRYWGFVPEDHIVGKPLFIVISIEGGVRWSRMFKGIN